MSVSKWAYTPEKCDGSYCYGDCDNCPKANEDEEGDDDMDEMTTHDLFEAMEGLYDKLYNKFVAEAAKIVEQAKERAQQAKPITNRDLIEHCSKMRAIDCINGGCKYKEICKKWKQKNEYAIPSDGRRFITAMKPEWLDAEADE